MPTSAARDASPPGVPEAGPTRPGGAALDRVATSDQRDAAIARLSDAFARDVLPVEEFERRVASVYRATTAGALRDLTGDLPEVEAERGARSTYPAHLRAMAPRITSFLSNVERGGPVAVPPRLEVRSTLGNVELDLRDASFDPGVTEIVVRALLGNVEVWLPPEVAVEDHGTAILGSFAVRTTGVGTGGPVVRIVGRAVLGNVEVGSGGAAPSPLPPGRRERP